MWFNKGPESIVLYILFSEYILQFVARNTYVYDL